ncbi:MAG: excinuclease ABC subunit UvrA, partial [bacterium]|nr:excinuclease ABC subunit UvrA [bacterium]
MMDTRELIIKGARVHNLQNVNLQLPRNELICFTGVSGSGKSSLAFDTIYAEGQRRYVESLSAYARQFLGQMEKPDVDQITGLSPTVSIEQKTAGRNPRSTVGTITEIYDYLRVLFARIGTPHCIHDDTPIGAQTRDGIVDQIMALGSGTRFHVMASLIQGRKGEYLDLFEDLLKEGYIRARVDGQIVSLNQVPKLERYIRHDIEVVIDRLVVKEEMRARIGEAVDAGLALASNAVIISPEGGEDILLSTNFSCPLCGRSALEPTPQLFSFNSPQGMCGDCHGLGTRVAMDLKKVVPDPSLSVDQGAIAPLGISKNRWNNHYYEAVLKRHSVALDTPWQAIPARGKHELMYGVEGRIQLEWRRRNGTIKKHRDTFEGILTPLERRFAEGSNPIMQRKLSPYMRVGLCPTCEGARLKKEALRVRINSRSLPEVTGMTIENAHRFFDSLDLTAVQLKIAEDALKEIRGRLTFLLDVGLNSLTLDRTAPTLSGGEAQRIRLASQIGSGLVGVTYVLDEPSIGLHHRDNVRLLDALCRLRDVGNTVIVVEHDEETMMRSDRVVDFGPGAGHLGGRVVAQGSWKQVARAPGSITGAYLSGKRKIEVSERRKVLKRGPGLWIRGARQNNLKNVDVKIPLGVFTCVTGVSGSGKSSLVIDVLYPVLARDLNGAETEPGLHRAVEGIDKLDKVIEIDQQPIGRTPRSNPATYTGAFDPIRKLFTELPESRVRGYKPGRFSFNVKGGRCEACQGNGANMVEMDFLADVWVPCSVCEGRRFNRETLDIAYKGKSISEVLEMEVEEACSFFRNVPQIYRVLKTLVDVGMGYVRLGQPAPTLSGGEAQRVKLSKELCRTSTGKTLYILDEPTTGLHFSDIQNLLDVLHRLVDLGNSVVVIEHNMDVVKTADWVIELGPEGGEEGGYLVASGTPDSLRAVVGSHTGTALNEILSGAHLLAASKVRKNGRGRKGQIKSIDVWGARENNLQDVNVSIPREKMTVISGVSGSGKSSMALDTIFAEGQRRYVESLSAYARQFLGQMPKPKVDRVVGLSPAIAIEQKAASKNPRSTVGTVTEIYDYVRALYGLLGSVYCPDCQVPAGSQTVSDIVKRVLAMPEGRRLFLLAPLVPGRGEDYATLIERAKRGGYLRGRVDGAVFDLDKPPEIDYRQTHRLEVLVDRVAATQKNAKRIADSAEKALELSRGVLIAASPDDLEETRFSLHLSCGSCGRSFEPVTPQHLSFNSPEGWCPSCEGLGTQRGMGVHTLIPDTRKSVAEGAVLAWGLVDPHSQLGQMVTSIGAAAGFTLDTPYASMSEAAKQAILYGLGTRWLPGPGKLKFQYKGLFPAIDILVRQAPRFRKQMGEFIQDVACPACRGHRINPVSAAVRLRDRTLPNLVHSPIRDVRGWFDALDLETQENNAAGEVLQEIHNRLRFLDEVGLGYIDLARKAPTLSGGEAQRIRLASQIGSGLTGVLYVLDEPTIGLHQRDNRRLLAALERLRNLGNTLIVVEHDRDTLEAADYILDFGPGAGTEGGALVANGAPKRLSAAKGSLTAQYLKNKMRIEVPRQRRSPNGKSLKVIGARQNNLKGVTVSFPLGLLTCVTGVSGSGKSSLVNDVLYGVLAARVNGAQKAWGEHDDIAGLEWVDKVINIDQTPIGFSPRSNPATYVKVFDTVRTLFSNLPDAQVRGFKPGHFSFNHKRGRCDACRGLGARCIEMHFLPDVWVQCESCSGKRYNRDVIDIRYKGVSISDVLTMTVAEALIHFE